MAFAPPSYQAAAYRQLWAIVAPYVHFSDLYAACLVCRQWQQVFAPLLWGAPASRFGNDSNSVYRKYSSTLGSRVLSSLLRLPPVVQMALEWNTHVISFTHQVQTSACSSKTRCPAFGTYAPYTSSSTRFLRWAPSRMAPRYPGSTTLPASVDRVEPRLLRPRSTEDNPSVHRIHQVSFTTSDRSELPKHNSNEPIISTLPLPGFNLPGSIFLARVKEPACPTTDWYSQ
jgi:hypothetical protein